MKTARMTASFSVEDLLGDMQLGENEHDIPWAKATSTEGGKSDRLEPSASLGTRPIYAVGRVIARFPTLSLEKEFYQALELAPSRQGGSEFSISDSIDLAILNQELDRTEILYSVLSKPENIYIARDMSWRFESPGGVAEFQIVPTGDEQVADLVAAIAPGPVGKPDLLILIGEMGGEIASPPGPRFAAVRVVALKKLLIQTANAPTRGYPTDDTSAIFQGLQSLLENEGTGPGDRALNYVLLNDTAFYSGTRALQQSAVGAPGPVGYFVSSVRTLQRPIGTATLVDVIFHYSSESIGSGIDYCVTVNVGSVFPFTTIEFGRYVPRKS